MQSFWTKRMRKTLKKRRSIFNWQKQISEDLKNVVHWYVFIICQLVEVNNKTIIDSTFAWYQELFSSAEADNIDLGLNNSWYHAEPHPIIV